MKRFLRKQILVLSMALLALSFTACTNQTATFNGSRISDNRQFLMEYSIFNMTESRSFALRDGDAIAVSIVSEAGDLSIVIQKDSDEPIYEGHGLSTGAFTVTVHESGTYDIAVTGKMAKGSVSVIVKESK